jgi:hypothetical protein
MLRYIHIQMCLKITQKAFIKSIFIKGDPDRFVECNSSWLKHLLAEAVDNTLRGIEEYFVQLGKSL